MRHYKYLILKNRVLLSRYLIHHCAIVDIETKIVYHLTRSYGYIAEPIQEVEKRYEIVGSLDFYSQRDIGKFMLSWQQKHGEYDQIDNNCEMFANAFYGVQVSRQTKFYKNIGMFVLFSLGALTPWLLRRLNLNKKNNLI